MKNSLFYNCSTSRNQHGLSLVELMISITIGMILLLGITALIVQQSSTRDELDKSSRQIENGRYATQLLHDDIQLAGYYGTYSPPFSTVYTAPDPCAQWNQGWSPTTVAMPIYGYPAAAAAPVACLDNYLPQTSVLVIRRVDTTPVAATSPVAGVTYLQTSSCSNETTPFVLGTNGFTLHNKDCVTAPPGTLAVLNRYIVRIYYVSSCNVCGTDTTPTLKVVENGGPANGGTLTPLVEGIENMRLDYGVDTLDAVTNTYDGYPDNYCMDPDVSATCATPIAVPLAAPANWANVMAISVNILARNTECTLGQTDIKQYSMGRIGNITPVNTCTNGAYKRHVFSELIRAVNPSARRALQ